MEYLSNGRYKNKSGTQGQPDQAESRNKSCGVYFNIDVN